MASLIQRLHLASHGEIKVNDLNINEFTHDSLLEHISYLSNQSHVFKGTIKDNLQLGSQQASDEAMMQALNLVDLKQFVMNQGGLMMSLEENGSNLSTGQRQRLVFARNLLKKTSFMILDETTANIDVESESIIMNAVKELSHSQGILMITHRLYHAFEADHVIYVSENGEVIFSQHQELMETQTGYRHLVNKQQELETVLEVKHA
jgi:ABC-type transport system involved in cytochrome bd biosynthesis fused ATPase/permease subunit